MEDKINKSLRYSFWDGVFASIMAGFSEGFISPYALAMNASTRLIGLIASVPNLIGSILQVRSAWLVERLGSRRTLINYAVFIHAMLWMPLILIPYIFKESRAVYVLIFYASFVALGQIAFPPWASLMADHVSETRRGKFFGARNRIMGAINLSCMFIAGYILNAYKKHHPENIFFGFTVIFSIAFISRIVSWYFLTRMHDPKITADHGDRFSLIDFMKRITRSNFGRFVIFVAAINFGANVAGPYFAVYMLKDLNMSYMNYAMILIASNVAGFFSMNMWGTRSDHVGNRRVLRFTSLFLPVMPILWLFSHNFYYLLLINAFGGFFWAGFNLSAFNFINDAASPGKRTRCIAYFNVINGIAIFSGASIGGYLIRFLPPLLGYSMLSLCVISACLRLLAAPLCSFFKEVRQVRKVSNLELFYSVVGISPGA